MRMIGLPGTPVSSLETCNATVFDDHVTQRACVAQGLLFGGSERKAVAHMRPEFPKMPTETWNATFSSFCQTDLYYYF